MNRPIFLLSLLVVILIIMALTIFPLIKSDTLIETSYDAPDALTWLRNHDNSYELASSPFTTNSEAIEFIEKLYLHGAESVYISEQCVSAFPEKKREEDRPYADGLIIKLSRDKKKRDNVITLCKKKFSVKFQDSLREEIKDDLLFLCWN